jgi:hypothetical protein
MFKKLFRRMKTSADYEKLRLKQHETIRLNPDITRKIITSDGDVIIVIFDNIGYHIKVRRIGSVHSSCRGHHTHKIATPEMPSLQSSFS